jgi:hypothetical protein
MPRKYQKREPEFPAPDAAPAAEEIQQQEPISVIVPTPPPPPNPAVIALQEDIVRLIRSRSEVRVRMLQAHATLQNAQSNFQIAQSEMKGIEDEVQYLHGQVAQLEGREQIRPGQYPGGAVAAGEAMFFLPGQMPNVSSEPTMPMNRPGSPFASPDGVNRAHANRADVI